VIYLSKLTIKQKKFADEYIISGNATEAAIKAGYSKKTARMTGSENLTKPYISEYIKERVRELEDEKIADMKEVREFWTNILRSGVEETKDRLKASEFIAKTQGAFIDRVQSTNDVTVTKQYENMTDEELEELIGKYEKLNK